MAKVNLAKELELHFVTTMRENDVITSRTLTFHMWVERPDFPALSFRQNPRSLSAEHPHPIPLFCILIDDISNAYMLGRRPSQ